MSTAMTPPLAALIYPDERHDIEDLLEGVARRLQQSGRQVGGLVHRQSRYANGNKCMRLLDLRSGLQFEMTEDLGVSSKACSLNPQALGLADSVLVMVTLDSHSDNTLEKFGEVLATIPEVVEAHLVSGEYDYLLRVVVKDTRDYERLLREKLYKIKGIRHSQSCFVLRTLKKSDLPLGM